MENIYDRLCKLSQKQLVALVIKLQSQMENSGEEKHAVSEHDMWEDIEKTGDMVGNSMAVKYNLPAIQEMKEKLEFLCAGYIMKTWNDLGAFQEQKSSHSIEELVKEYGILSKYEPLMGKWCDFLVKLGFLSKSENKLYKIRESNFLDIKQELTKMLAESGEAYHSARLIKQFGSHLKEMITGKVRPQSILFEDGSQDLTEGIYRDNETSHFYNNMVKSLCEAIIHRVPKERKIRILEIGAGTGSLTESILPILPPDRTQYTFTDVSHSFLHKAEVRFSQYTFVDYKLFNIEENIEKQGLGKESYDIILASNVIHAAKNIKEALNYVSEALAQGGIMILLEMTKPSLFFEMTFGLLVHKIEDPWYRPEQQVILTADEWKSALSQEGFDKVLAFPAVNDGAENVMGQHVVAARKKREMCSENAVEKEVFSCFAKTEEKPAGSVPEVIKSEKKKQTYEEESGQDEDFFVSLKNIPVEGRKNALVQYLKKQISIMLGFQNEEPLAENLSLVELGIDSLMMLDLRKLLEQKLGVSLPTGTFYENPTIWSLAGYFNDEIQFMGNSYHDMDQLIAGKMRPDKEHRLVPFPMTPVQKAYITPYSKEQESFILTGAYYEFESSNLDVARLNHAIDMLAARHDMLRAVILNENQQVIVDEVPNFLADVIDLQGQSKEAVRENLEITRRRESYALCQEGSWPLFDVKVHLIAPKKWLVHIFLPGCIMDAVGEGLFFGGLKELYYNENTAFETLESGYRSYVMAVHTLSQENAFEESKKYWWQRLLTMPAAVRLPVVQEDHGIAAYRYVSRTKVIEREVWNGVKTAASEKGLTPSGYLCAVLCEVLYAWSRTKKFSINAMAYNRFIPHREINKIMGNMSSTLLIASDYSMESFEERAGAVQKQLLDGFHNRYVSTIQVLKELENTYGRIFEKEEGCQMNYLSPVTFDSLMGITSDPSNYSWLGDMTTQRIERHPELLDCQVMERQDGALVVKWDTVDFLLSEEQCTKMFEMYRKLILNLL